ncbi:hypothetical protein POVWA1_019460 [Plasmodium ovale wallikeri]|uniref:Uncharacterized protein n=1 Tax=Plasmodium ovale wallikeri TaxID=864142 RepID=A0A1A8YQX6_PLAOA|nr:hypothetical protein POVWA1_019460 [Plasmodium ovale wallikeri]
MEAGNAQTWEKRNNKNTKRYAEVCGYLQKWDSHDVAVFKDCGYELLFTYVYVNTIFFHLLFLLLAKRGRIVTG